MFREVTVLSWFVAVLVWVSTVLDSWLVESACVAECPLVDTSAVLAATFVTVLTLAVEDSAAVGLIDEVTTWSLTALLAEFVSPVVVVVEVVSDMIVDIRSPLADVGTSVTVLASLGTDDTRCVDFAWVVISCVVLTSLLVIAALIVGDVLALAVFDSELILELGAVE